ncbi:NADPH-dependent 1-acyldihydroxyacetone phosphate reductase [Candida viswanathii]|uniref:NADPH-dependent 1-acyldihydroxyacetone phosphate reductase n=1 Tax=Candida viswanathii TaxID=5486 RepID=A0A367YHM4_9ASCO|nr:NADPH-dependent 1-acyldihydroxyacetone phosphate reductase [Candida viswanathii]
MSEQRQKYAVITGASSGIGYALAKEFSKRNYKVFGLSPESVLHLQEPLEKQYGLVSIACDITKLSDIEHAKDIVSQQTQGEGYVDVLYNNAGIAIGSPAIAIPPDQLDRIFQVNVLGHINVTRAFAPLVIRAKGSIVYTSSVAARVPLSWVSAYLATKSAIDSYARTLHGELEPFGVRVHSVITGGVQTQIGKADNDIHDVEKQYQGSPYNVDGMVDSVLSALDMALERGVTPDVYARDIVGKIVRKSRAFNLYGGGRGYLLHLISWLSPFWLIEFLMQLTFKQLKPFKIIRKKYQ